MAKRLRIFYLILLLSVLAVLVIPYARSVAQKEHQGVYIDRLQDTTRFSLLAEQALRSGDMTPLEMEIQRYDQLYGIEVWVLDGDQKALAASEGMDSAALQVDLAASERIQRATQGLPTDQGDSLIWPWNDRKIVVAEPIGQENHVQGAVVTVSPTDALRQRVEDRLGFLAGLCIVVIALGYGFAFPLSRWIMGPVSALDKAAREIAGGKLETRVKIPKGPDELTRLADTFNLMANRVSDAMERQRSFVADASHQLRNPLTALRLRVENLAAVVVPAGRGDHASAVEEADRLASILDDLLALARAETAEPPVDPVDVGEAADERVRAWRAAASSRAVDLRRSGEAHAKAFAVRSGLDRVLDALLDNALKYSPPGSQLIVHVDEFPVQEFVEVHVIDQGPGLTEEDCARAVDRFWRKRSQQNAEGSGLGLTIANALMRSSGGRLDLMPSEPQGLDVRVRLPTNLASAVPQ